MKITREKACQRLHHRISTPLHVLIEGAEYSASDWSLGGLRIVNWDQWDDESLHGKQLECKFELPFQGFNIAFEVTTEVVRYLPDSQELGLKFVDLDERQIELLNHFVEQLVRGSMMSVEDTILRIDSPVTPVSTKPDASPAHEVPVHRFPLKLIAMSSLYGLIGVTLFSLVAITVYENFFNLKVKSAFTTSATEPLVSLVDGRLHRVDAKMYSNTQTGDALMTIESPDIAKRIEEAKIFIEQKQLELEAHRKRHILAIEVTGSSASEDAQLHQIEIDLVQQEVALAMQKLVALYDYRDDLSILSPSQGRIVKLLRKQGALIKRGETLAIFERNEPPRIHAYLTEAEARSISLNLNATIRPLNVDKEWLGRVEKIHLAPYGSTSQLSRANQHIDSSRPVLVEISLPTSSSETLMNLSSGLPIEVLFPTTRLSLYINRVFRGSDDDSINMSDQWSARRSHQYGSSL
ncbi:MAG: PilZ domain-containing protein [Cellvibrionaceae bacterium]